MVLDHQCGDDFRVDDADDQSGLDVVRMDFSSLPKTIRTDEGFLRAPATRVGRVGVQEYLNTDGTTRRELRLPEHVFAPDSLATLEGKPVVHGHPRPLGTAVTASNARDMVRGSASSPRADGEFVVADLTVYDGEMISAAQQGENEVSLGYRTRLVPIPGKVFRQDGHPLDGTPADLLQTNIRYNHVALLRRGRANEGLVDRPVQLRLDGAGNQVPEDSNEFRFDAGEGKIMDEEITINGQTFKVPAAVAAQMKADRARADGAEKRADEAEKAYTEADDKRKAAEKARDQNAARADSAESKLKDVEKARADEAEAAKSADRFTLMKHAEAITKKPAAELVKLDDPSLRRAILQVKCPSLTLDGKTDDYVAAMLDFELEREKQTKNSAGSLRGSGGAGGARRDDSAEESPLAKAHKERTERVTGAWKSN